MLGRASCSWTAEGSGVLTADSRSRRASCIGYETVVGAIQVAVGYKLNPSALDIRSPAAVLAALDQGRPLSTVPTENGRRWHLHFAIGTSF
jgi:hypothetical protein